MAKHSFSFASFTLKDLMYLFMLFVVLQVANSARILDEVDPESSTFGAANTVPSGQFTTVAPTTVVEDGNEPPAVVDNDSDSDLPPIEDDDSDTVVPPVAPITTIAPSGPTPTVVAPIAKSPVADDDFDSDVLPVVSPDTTVAPNGPAQTVIAPIVDVLPVTVTEPGPGPVTTAVPSAPAATGSKVVNPDHPQLCFFMHDILGGIHPSARVVTGIIANSGVNGLFFSKPNSQVFPINGGVPLPNNINGIINNNNNIPFLTGLNTGSQANTIFQNNGNNNVVAGYNQPFVTAGQLPSGATLQELMFGTVTVIDDELTEGHELGSAVMGKAQGFYLSSSLDGTSHTIALTAVFHSGNHHDGAEDTVSFFGVHRTASLESHIAVTGGTGKYESAKGYATIGSIQMEDQHTTDGIDAILQVNVYLTH